MLCSSLYSVSVMEVTTDELEIQSNVPVTFYCNVSNIDGQVTVLFTGDELLEPDLLDLSASNAQYTVDQGTYDSVNRTQIAELVVLQSTLQTMSSGEMFVICDIEDSAFSAMSAAVELFVPGKHIDLNTKINVSN